MKLEQLETANTLQGHLREIAEAMSETGAEAMPLGAGEPATTKRADEHAIKRLLRVVDNETLVAAIRAQLFEAARLRLQNLQVQFENL